MANASSTSSTSTSSTHTPPTATGAQSRNWVFTLNNHSSVDIPRVFEHVKYCVWQEERGANGTKHLQGYVIFEGSRRLASLKKLLPTAHWEIRRGTHEEARDYCVKEESRLSGPFYIGDEPLGTTQGARSDLLSIKRKIDEGSSDLDLWESEFSTMMKFHKGVAVYKRLKSEVRNFKSFVIVLTGPTGTGKSHQANRFPHIFHLSNPGGGKSSPIWFDGYDDRTHRTLLIDEFYGWIPYDLLLRILDRFPLAVPIKGGFVNFAPKYIVITSNKDPADWYHFERFAGNKEPLFRRLDLVIVKWSRDTYKVMKSIESPNSSIEISEDEIDFKRFVPDFD